MAIIHDSGSDNYVSHVVEAVFKTRPDFIPDKWIISEDAFTPEEADLEKWPEGACFVCAVFTYNFTGDDNDWDDLKAGDALLRYCKDDNDNVILANIGNDID